MTLGQRSLRWLDGLWVLAWVAFIVAGMPIVSFHGDEPMQIYMSHDYATAFIYREPQRLTTNPPYDIDSDPQLRILNGSVNRYAIGLSWHLAGMTNGDLPPRPGWDWGLDYQTNVDTNHRPSDRLLLAGRLSSTMFLALSSAVMFGLGWQFGGRPLACFATALYSLNPIILLNGRRAMMEGSMLFFGLLTILLAVVIGRRRERGAGGLWAWWAALILAGGLALTSKHSAVIFVASALGWVFIAELMQRKWMRLAATGLKLIVSAALIATVFVVLSPALWNDPLARLQDLIATRQTLLEIQVTAHTAGAMNQIQRAEMILTQPFLTPAAHFEVAAWAGYDPITAEVERYMNSPLSGLQFGLLGLPLTLVAVFGLLALLVPRLRPERCSPGQAVGVFVWLLITLLALMSNPLPWQRYYVPLIPLATLLVGIGLSAMIHLIRWQDKNPLVVQAVRPQTE